MSALEIIQQIKALPLDEQQEVKAYVFNLDENSHDVTNRAENKDAFDSALDSVFAKHDVLLQKLAQ